MHTATAKKLEMYRAMLLTRRFEEALSELCKIEGTIHGMMILCTGQEGVAAGVCAALEPADAIITNHRSHGHLLAKGADPNTLMAEIAQDWSTPAGQQLITLLFTDVFPALGVSIS